MTPEKIAELESYLQPVRDLGDGRKAGLLPLTFGRMRLVVWQATDPSYFLDGY